jgi:3'-phosphoadenosine 5'-phosphosulfate (PAPS) 3'-phosphatase
MHPLGGAVMNGLSTIELAPAIYYKQPKTALGGGSLWDFAASSVIQSEAGGFNSDYHQNQLDLNRKDSTFMNHKGVIFGSSKELIAIISRQSR